MDKKRLLIVLKKLNLVIKLMKLAKLSQMFLCVNYKALENIV